MVQHEDANGTWRFGLDFDSINMQRAQQASLSDTPRTGGKSKVKPAMSAKECADLEYENEYDSMIALALEMSLVEM